MSWANGVALSSTFVFILFAGVTFQVIEAFALTLVAFSFPVGALRRASDALSSIFVLIFLTFVALFVIPP